MADHNIESFIIIEGWVLPARLAPICVDDNGLVWIGTGWDYDGLYIFDPKNNIWDHLVAENSDLPNNWVYDIEILGDSRAWIGCDSAFVQYDFRLKKFHSKVNLPKTQTNDARALLLDRNSDLWIGTYSSGLQFYNGLELKRVNQFGSKVYDITIRPDNTIFFSTDNAGVQSISDGNITKYDIYGNGGVGDYTSITADSLGNIWVSIEGGYEGYIGNGVQWQIVTPSDIMCEPMCVTNTGTIYTQAKNRGLVVWNGIKWVYFDTFDSPFNDTESKYLIYGDDYSFHYSLSRKGITEGPNGDIWMVAGGKLMRYRPSLGEYP